MRVANVISSFQVTKKIRFCNLEFAENYSGAWPESVGRGAHMPVGSVPANCREIRLTPIPENYVKETLEDLSLLMLAIVVPAKKSGLHPAVKVAASQLRCVVRTNHPGQGPEIFHGKHFFR